MNAEDIYAKLDDLRRIDSRLGATILYVGHLTWHQLRSDANILDSLIYTTGQLPQVMGMNVVIVKQDEYLDLGGIKHRE